ncbi:N-acetylglucosamine-6-phosphate deacetylase [Paramixta manurensis]|uniref:N-acetylglucosamine-6-phosphate deacetylase n=1 Tax=Paramixta manurensis TaxID=2740817 RepID=A0A6M8U9A7_9GAMM|nr:N-acetylglucosamine-6-phosphate deacetylase [Erwiniaceae bacterium PD-1]
MPEQPLRGRHYRTLQPIEVRVAEGMIRAIQPVADQAALPLIAPGLVDLQVNGYAAIDFNHFPFSVDEVAQVTRELWRQGVTTFMPTVITADSDVIEQAVKTLAEACEEHPEVARAVCGIHLEGPFLSPEDGPRGAHPRAHIKAPDAQLFRRWQAAAGGRITLLTLSPEWPTAPDFIRTLTAMGVVVSLGHTAATPEQIITAVEAGARMSTHLGNGAHLQLPRHPNYIWQQLAQDELACALIADGDHLPLSVLKVCMRVKGEQAFLVSDVTRFAGMAAGVYDAPIGGRVRLSENGRLAMAEQPQLLAGSAKGLFHGVNHLVHHALAPLPQALEMASIRPARQMGLPSQQGLNIGAPADLILLTPSNTHGLTLTATWKAGRKVWG